MKLILDTMGGDNSPAEIIKGAVAAISEYDDIEIILVGKEEIIKSVFEGEKLNRERIASLDAHEFITMDDLPTAAVMSKKQSSMSVGLRALAAGEGDAFISAGNTGALMTGATMLVKCVEGIRRAAIATILPMERPTLLIDSGSNVTVTAENMLEFAILGSVYMERVLDVKAPKVGLLNNGTEEHKGTKTAALGYKLLSEAEGINFIGNIEGKDIPFGVCDVIVTDGFTGNIVLKTIEGVSKFLFGKLRDTYAKNALTMLSAKMIKSGLSGLKKSFDAREYGGAPFLGVAKPVFKAHGNSDSTAIKNAIRQAREYINGGVSEIIRDKISELHK